MRTVLSDSSVQQYLDKLIEAAKFSYGIVIGQPSKHGKDYVIHMAKTPYSYEDEMTPSQTSSADENSTPSDPKPINNIDSISAEALIEHSLRAIWMLPGGFYVLGIFMVTPEMGILDKQENVQKLKGVLMQLTDVLKENKTISAACDDYDNNEKLLFHYASKRAFQCKSIEMQSTGITKPAEWKFQDRLPQWQQIETIYDTEHVFPLVKRQTGGFSLEENLSFSVDNIAKQLEVSCVFFDGEPWTGDESLESILKKRQNRNEPTILQSSIYFPCKERLEDEEAKIVRYDGTIKYSGIVSSKIWVQSKLLIDDIQKFIKADILRSISARLRLYLDASTNDFQGNLEHIVITEPPRRVYFDIKPSSSSASSNNGTTILFCDYLFRGECDATVIEQAKEILDIDLTSGQVINDVETISEIENDKDLLAPESTDKLVSNSTQTSKDKQRLMMILGVFFAIGVLFISIGLHFVFNAVDSD